MKFHLQFCGVIATLQPANFVRIYVVCGGIFIILTILLGWKVDGFVPDKFDNIGGINSLLGMGIIMFALRIESILK